MIRMLFAVVQYEVTEGFYTQLETGLIYIKIRSMVWVGGLWILPFLHPAQKEKEGWHFCTKERKILGSGHGIHPDDIVGACCFLQRRQGLFYESRVVVSYQCF